MTWKRRNERAASHKDKKIIKHVPSTQSITLKMMDLQIKCAFMFLSQGVHIFNSSVEL